MLCFDESCGTFKLARIHKEDIHVIRIQTSPSRDALLSEDRLPAVLELTAADLPRHQICSVFDYLVVFEDPSWGPLWKCVDQDEAESSIAPASPLNICRLVTDVDFAVRTDLIAQDVILGLGMGPELFLTAAKFGNVRAMRHLAMTLRVDPYSVDSEGRSALHLVAGYECVSAEAAEDVLSWFVEYRDWLPRGKWKTLSSEGDHFHYRQSPCNPFHAAAKVGNVEFIHFMRCYGTEEPDWPSKCAAGEMELSYGSLWLTKMFLFEPYGPQESLIPFSLIDAEDSSGRRPVNLADSAVCATVIEEYTRELNRFRFSKSLSGKDSLDQLLTKYSLTAAEASEIIKADPSLLSNLRFWNDEAKIESILSLAEWDISSPLSEVVSCLGYSWPLKSLVELAFEDLLKPLHGSRVGALKEWESESSKIERRLSAVMMATHPRLGANSPLGRLPHHIVKRIALQSLESPVSLEMLSYQSRYALGRLLHEPQQIPFRMYLVALGIMSAEEANCFYKVGGEVRGFIKWLVTAKGISYSEPERWRLLIDAHHVEGLSWLLDTNQVQQLDSERAKVVLRAASCQGSLVLLDWAVRRFDRFESEDFKEALFLAIVNQQHQIAKWLEKEHLISFLTPFQDGRLAAHVYLESSYPPFGVIASSAKEDYLDLLKFYSSSAERRDAYEPVDWDLTDTAGRSVLSYASASKNFAILQAARQVIKERKRGAAFQEATRLVQQQGSSAERISEALADTDAASVLGAAKGLISFLPDRSEALHAWAKSNFENGGLTREFRKM